MEKTYYPLNEDAARTAWNMNHMGTFRSDEGDYRGEVDEAWSLADEASERNPERAGEAYLAADRYARRLAEWYNKKYRIDSMCPSILVSGGGNFPVAKKSRQNRAWDGHYRELREIESLKERIRKIGTSAETIKSDDESAIEKLRAKAEALANRQEAMKAENAKAREEGREAPFPPYTLSNNGQNLRSVRKRIEQLEAQKGKDTSQREVNIMGESALAVENVELMRLQIIFDGKPGEETRSALKHSGFRWSPKNGAWQRQLTDNARFALRLLSEE